MGAKAPLTGYQYLRPKARGYRALGRTVSPPPTWTGDPFLAHRYFRFLLYGMEAATSGGLQAGNNFAQDAAQVFGRAATDQIENLGKVSRGVAEHTNYSFRQTFAAAMIRVTTGRMTTRWPVVNHGRLASFCCEMATQFGSHQCDRQTGNDSRSRAFHVRWPFQKEALMGHGEREPMLKNLSKKFLWVDSRIRMVAMKWTRHGESHL